jgi:ubiquitin C-terminal hydrolase
MYLDLSLQVDGCKDLLDSFKQLTTFEELSGDNKYHCDNCGGKVEQAMRGAQLRTIPPILTISLSRFTYDPYADERVKITKNYQFPLELSMTDFIEDRSI